MHPKCVCGRGSAPDPLGELTALPRPLSVFEVAASWQGRRGEGKGGEGKWTLATLRTDWRPCSWLFRAVRAGEHNFPTHHHHRPIQSSSICNWLIPGSSANPAHRSPDPTALLLTTGNPRTTTNTIDKSLQQHQTRNSFSDFPRLWFELSRANPSPMLQVISKVKLSKVK